MPITIRIAQPEDIHAVRQLETEVALVHNALRPDLYRSHPGLMTEEYYSNLLNDPNQFAFLAVNDTEEIIGVAFAELKNAANSYCYRDFTKMHIHLLCVQQNWQNKGVGSLLIDRLRQTAAERDCYSMELNVWQCNEKAVSFYRAQGFQEQVLRMEMILPGKTIDVSNTYIQTPRLVLRPWKENDLEDFYSYASVPGVGEMAGWPHHENMETSKMILDSFIAKKNTLAIQHLQSNKVIGSFGFHKSWANELPEFSGLKSSEIGYVLSKEYWGQGLMPEAVRAIIPYCFNALHMDILTVGHFDSNHQSQRVIEKSGFVFHSDEIFYAKQLGIDIHSKRYYLLRPGLKR